MTSKLPQITSERSTLGRAPDALYLLRGHASSVNSLAFSSLNSTTQLASGDGGGEVRIWDLQRRRPRCVLQAHSKLGVLSIAGFDAPNVRLVTQGRDEAVKVWDLEGAQPTIVGWIKTGNIDFCRAHYLASHEWVAATSETPGDVNIWDINTKQKVCTIPGPKNERVVDADKMKSTDTSNPADGGDLDILSMLDGTGGNSGSMRDGTSAGKRGMCMSVKMFLNPSSGNPMLLAGYEDGSLFVHDIGERSVVAYTKSHVEPIMAVAIAPDATGCITGSADNSLVKVSLKQSDSGALSVKQQLTMPMPAPGVNEIVIRQDKRIIVAGGWDGNVRVYGYRKGNPLCVLSRHRDSIQAVATHKCDLSGWLLAAGSKDKNISLWSIYNQ
eukprot:CFRG8344T1